MSDPFRSSGRTENTDRVIALPKSSASGMTVLAVYGGLVLIVMVAALAGSHLNAHDMLLFGGLLLAFFVPLGLLMWAIVSRTQRARFTANDSDLTVRWSGKNAFSLNDDSFPLAAIKSVKHFYRDPSLAETALVAAVKITSGNYAHRALPTPEVLVRNESGHHPICVSAFALRPEALARRINRYRRFRDAGLRPSESELEAQRARFVEPTVIEARGILPRSTRVVKLSREGLSVGWSAKRLKLVPWERIVCAHAVPWVNPYNDLIQVELTDGSALNIWPRVGMSNDEAAELMAPRYGRVGETKEHTILDAPAAEDDEAPKKQKLIWNAPDDIFDDRPLKRKPERNRSQPRARNRSPKKK